MVTEAKKLVKLDIPKKLGVWKTTKVAAKKSPVKPILYYVGLEALEARYTLQLTEWNTRVFKDMAVNYHVVKGHELDARKAIDVGQVLDAFGRPFYALQQIQSIITLIRNGSIKKNDILFFEDMFHPGFEALPYIFNQLGWRPKIFVRCLAQSIDPDDFVHVTGMTDWMRKFEQIVNLNVDAVLIASHEMAACATTAGWKVPLIVTGLPFGKYGNEPVKYLRSTSDRSRWYSQHEPIKRNFQRSSLTWLRPCVQGTRRRQSSSQFSAVVRS
jgi:hypothetical protein